MMLLKGNFAEYTATEFEWLLKEIIEAAGSEFYQDTLLEHFIAVTEHPEGSDLIFYPADGKTQTPGKIIQRIVGWRAANGRAGLKGG
ncbi:bacteriocin immunity protein [Pseudomonas rubra]|uniref:Bacteriocin immunity protein n=1 Tax=Pseudomonas rubra TaxID=2942627 RepID=A0ABT5PAN5_9PSED|nr:bacteriocin immunity protein [Pseudomonas rubra]MDD1015247.1 bacteriocin immunity protein [Pseudomonas rubra]MDD1039469.1 bacteriocin immunity protein [Pseudomonas rubra]MDD1154105.1 bacteriocin immunity protein [Pseudomonas rubra]